MQITAIRTALRVIFGLSVSLLVTGITRGTRHVAGVSGNANIMTDHSYVRPLLPLRSGVWLARHRRSVAIALLLALGLSTTHFPLTDGRARAASVGVTIGATTVSAGTVAPGRFVDLSSSIRTNANLQGAIVDYYIVDSSGHTVTQLVDNPVSFSANIPQTISQRWVVPSGQAAASYTFKIGIFGQNWSPLMAWNDQAGSVTIMAFNPTSTPPALPTSTPPALPTNTATALPTNTATALPTNTASVGVTIGATTVSAGTVAPGRFVDLSSSIRTNANLQGAIVDYYIVDSSGHTVTQLVDNPVSFSANIPQTISQRWVVPSGQAAASYTFKIGIFGQNWSPLMAWNDQAGSVTIMAFNPTSTPPTLPTSTPPALPTSTPPALPTNTATVLPTNTATVLPTNTATTLPTNTATTLPTNTATTLPTNTATVLPTNTATALPTNTATALPTNTATALPTNIATALPTNTVSQTGNANGSYISHTGTQLTLNGSPLRVTGYNYTWMGTNCSDPSDADLNAAFAAIQNASRGTIVRTAFYQSASNNGSFADFDRYVAAAKNYGLRIVPMLINEWTDCEPSSSMKYLPWYQTGYTQANDGYPLSFHDYAVRLAAHYANEPTIAWWQLVNEPDARNADNSCSESTAASALRAFADTMTGAIKAADPHHMVDLGAVSWCGGQGNDYQLINAGKTDLCDAYHDYGSPTTPMPSNLQNHLNACHSDNKPAFVGEAGICADVTTTGSCGGTVTAASLTQRASLFKAKMDAAFTAGAAGYIIWEQGTSSVGWGVGPGDPTEGVMAAS